MPSLSAEKRLILTAIAAALGEPGEYDLPVPLSYPVRAEELRPDLLSIIESVELVLGVPIDREALGRVKPVKIDLFLPQRGLYIELDRAEHDLGAARGTTLLYYPEGLPKGFSRAQYKALTARRTPPSGVSSRMGAGRAMNDLAKDLFIEGQLGAVLVRLQKEELTWLLAKGDPGAKQARLKGTLTALAEALDLPQLQP